MMKKLLIILFLVAIAFPGIGQTQKPPNLPAFDYKILHFGFTVGLNVMDFGIDRNYTRYPDLYADVTRIQPGFQVSIVSDLKLDDNLNLRFLPGISFGAREIIFYEDLQNDGNWTIADRNGANSKVRVGPAFLDFPLHLKYRAKRDNNYRPYLVGGINFRYDMAAKRAYDGESNDFIRLNAADLYFEIGFGVDTYLKYFKLKQVFSNAL